MSGLWGEPESDIRTRAAVQSSIKSASRKRLYMTLSLQPLLVRSASLYVLGRRFLDLKHTLPCAIVSRIRHDTRANSSNHSGFERDSSRPHDLTREKHSRRETSRNLARRRFIAREVTELGFRFPLKSEEDPESSRNVSDRSIIALYFNGGDHF